MSVRRVSVGIVLALVGGRLLFLPVERMECEAEVRAAYEEYRACLRIDIFCAPVRPCPYLNCLGDFLRRSEEMNTRHLLLSTIDGRTLLSGWHPPAP